MNSPRHIPVMLNEVLDTLKPEAGKIYVDATFGNGGYSEAILKTANCTVIALDRDPTVRTRAEEIKNYTATVLNLSPELSAILPS